MQGHGSTFSFIISVPVVPPPVRSSTNSPSLSPTCNGSGTVQPAAPLAASEQKAGPCESDAHGSVAGAESKSDTSRNGTFAVTSRVHTHNCKVTGVETHVQFAADKPNTPALQQPAIERPWPGGALSSNQPQTQSQLASQMAGRGHTPPILSTMNHAEREPPNEASAATQSSGATRADTKSDRSPKGGMSLLVVEDSAIVQKVMAKMLTQLGHTYTIATNGREALDLVFQRKCLFDAGKANSQPFFVRTGN